MEPCPNCKVLVDHFAICPNCGAMLSPVGGSLARIAWLDMVLGLLAGLAAVAFGLRAGTKMVQDISQRDVSSANPLIVGLVFAPAILYFVLRSRYPSFAKGLAMAFIVFLIALLGALVWCIGSAFATSGQPAGK